MTPEMPIMSASSDICSNDTINRSCEYGSMLRANAIPPIIMLTINVNHMIPTTRVRCPGPDKSVANDKYDTVAKLNPIPHAPNAKNPKGIPHHTPS
jgi:hypothetical protein